MAIIEVESVTKVFQLRRGRRAFLSNAGLVNLFKRRPPETFCALDDISFALEAGHSLGIIGANGSGKSTLLKILAGVTVPTSGEVRIHGRVASLLELGAGFHPLLTGRENVYLNAGILGMRHAQVDQAFDDIVEFSGIREFIDNPVDTYSSGMYVRIAFAVAVYTNPDIFLVDEVLSVGDEEFQRKCRTRIGELREQGKTIVFVSHDLSIVNTLCDQVILLSKGQMIRRETPKATIDFYLRQVGRAQGIHTLAAGEVEAIVSHGRVSAFHAQHEASAPAGFSAQILCMEQWHHSSGAEWEMTERGPASCTARGRMPRLPVVQHWDVTIEAGVIRWTLALECEHETSFDEVALSLFFPQAYAEWFYADASGAFPEILPSDLNWTNMLSPDLSCRDVFALPREDAALPPVAVHLDAAKPYVRLEWLNTDYIGGCRVLRIGARLPESDLPLAPGRHEFFSLSIDLHWSAAEARARAKAFEDERVLTSGKAAARFDRGCIHLTYDGRELTQFVFLYASMLIGNLWNDSHNLQWGPVHRTGNCLRATGESRRFPYRQHWEMEAVDDGLSLRIWLEVLEAFEAEEYHTTIGLIPAYDRWETAHESGVFPPFEPGQQDWRHANRNYAVGPWIRAAGPELPEIALENTSAELPLRMTAINTGCHQNAHVLQALRTPDSGRLRFEPGRHLYFEGAVRVTPPSPGTVPSAQ